MFEQPQELHIVGEGAETTEKGQWEFNPYAGFPTFATSGFSASVETNNYSGAHRITLKDGQGNEAHVDIGHMTTDDAKNFMGHVLKDYGWTEEQLGSMSTFAEELQKIAKPE